MIFILDDVNQRLARFELSDVLTRIILYVEMHIVVAAGSSLGICGRRLILREYGRSEKKNSKEGSHITPCVRCIHYNLWDGRLRVLGTGEVWTCFPKAQKLLLHLLKYHVTNKERRLMGMGA